MHFGHVAISAGGKTDALQSPYHSFKRCQSDGEDKSVILCHLYSIILHSMSKLSLSPPSTELEIAYMKVLSIILARPKLPDLVYVHDGTCRSNRTPQQN